MAYALTMLWREQNRFLPAVLAVAFSAVLVAVQSAVLLGVLGTASRPIDTAAADVWVGSRHTQSIGYGRPIAEGWRARLASQPEVVQTETYLIGFTMWNKPRGGAEQCYVIGTRLAEGSIGAMGLLGPDVRGRLAEAGAVAVMDVDRAMFGLEKGEGEVAQVSGRRVRVVSCLRDLPSLGIPGVFCSERTARSLLPAVGPDETMYVIGRCRSADEVPAVCRRLRQRYPEMTVWTRSEFSAWTRWTWLVKTRAGIALGGCVLLGLLVGSVVTAQTMYGATAASVREYAVLRAEGIPGWRTGWLTVQLSFLVGVSGLALAAPVTVSAAWLARPVGLEVEFPAWLLTGAAALILLLAVGSGLTALRALRQAEPATLLR